MNRRLNSIKEIKTEMPNGVLFSMGTSSLPASREAQAIRMDRGVELRERKREAERETENVEGRRGDMEEEVRGENSVLEMAAIFRERVEKTIGNDAKRMVFVLNTADISKTAPFSFHPSHYDAQTGPTR